MARELIAADVVLCICTLTYRARFEGTASAGGFGVAWEGHLITTELYRGKGRAGRFLPIQAGDADAIPVTLRGQPALPFDDHDGIVAALGGTVGPPRPAPEVHAGWTEAMTVGALVGPIWKPLRKPKGGEGYAPTQLLRAEHAVVPFLGRAQQLHDLEDWCQGGGTRVRVVHGPGGAGKTRLALEIAANRCREGWRAGPLAVCRDVEAPNEYLDALFRDRIPLFLIVDYAETRHDLLIRLLQRLARVQDCSARVLLVARGKGDWWDRAMAEVPELDRMGFGWRDVRVDEAEVEREHAEKAAAAFATWMGREVPRSIADRGRTVLDRQVEALVAVLGPGPLEGLGQLLRHEDHFLREAGGVVDLPRTLSRRLPALMALYTLAGGLAADAAREWIAVVDGLDDLRNAHARAIVDLLGDLYPREGGGIDGMRPDRVGEALVAREDGDGKLAVAAVDRGRGKAALTVLTRLGATGEERPLSRALPGLLTREFASVVEVSVEVGAPLPACVADGLKASLDFSIAKSLMSVETVALTAARDVAARILAYRGESPLDRMDGVAYLALRGDPGGERVGAAKEMLRFACRAPDGRKGDRRTVRSAMVNLSHAFAADGDLTRAGAILSIALKRVPPSGSDSGNEELNEVAGIAMAYATHLEASGEAERGLDFARRGVEVFRRERHKEAGNLSHALTDLSSILWRTHRLDEAVATGSEAVTLLRSLHKSEPGRFELALARALATLARALADTGQSAKAASLLGEEIGVLDQVQRWDRWLVPRKYVEATKRLAGVLWRTGDWDGAIATAESAVQRIKDAQQWGATVPLEDLVAAFAMVAHLNLGAGRHRAAFTWANATLELAARTPDGRTPRTLKLLSGVRETRQSASLDGVLDPDTSCSDVGLGTDGGDSHGGAPSDFEPHQRGSEGDASGLNPDASLLSFWRVGPDGLTY